jgi:hypothetical protein
MKIKEPEGNCKHGILKKEYCEKCWEKMAKENYKKTVKFLIVLDKAHKNAGKSKLMFDRIVKETVSRIVKE